ncbi:MFS transporter [Streptomyces sp. NPDC001380]|uniref:MFS transporter n=1 Tax=Streptomyces sp. NPDC001380 TaxID=3364566 RepID=UPI0036C3615D
MEPSPVRRHPRPALLVQERPRPRRVREHPGAWRLAVATVCLGAFMGQLDASIVTLAYPSLGAGFGASPAAVEWVSLVYLLVLAALLVPVGRLADARGRKLCYLYGFAVFTAGSAACGLAPSLPSLIAFRAVQAVGAAMLQANSVALVTTSAPRERMRSALGMQAAAQALGLALGPTVGGALVGTAGWRWVFGINVPVGVAALAAGHYLLPRTRNRTGATAPGRGRSDPAGLLLMAAATTCALLGLSAASGLGLPGWAAASLFVLAAAAGWGFAARQRRAADPLVDPAVLRGRAVPLGLAGALCGYLVLFGPLVLVPAVLDGHGETALTAGLVLTALPAGFALAAVGADRVLPRGLGDRGRCLLGAAAAAAALAGLLAAAPTAARLAPLLALLGVGLGVFTPANNSAVMRAVPARAAAAGGGLVSMARGLGTALGVAVVTLALHLAPDGAAGFRWAVSVLLAAAAGAAATAAYGAGRRPAG